MMIADEPEITAQVPDNTVRIDSFNEVTYARHAELTRRVEIAKPPAAPVREAMHPLEMMDHLRTLSLWSTLECALTNLPMGGTGINLQPFSLAQFEKDNAFPGWVNRVKGNTGKIPSIFEPGPLATANNMQLIMEEFESLHGYRFPALNNSQPDTLKGELDRCEASAFSMVVTLREALKELGIPINKSTAVVQGCGEIARHAIKWFTKLGGRVVGVSCPDEQGKSFTYYRKSEGINIDKLLGAISHNGTIDKAVAASLYYEVLPGDSWIEEDADLLLLCGSDQRINGLNADRISPEVKVVAEGAPGAIAQEAEVLLSQQGIMVIPGFLANAGGAVCSFYDMVRHGMSRFLSKKEVLTKIDEKLTPAFREIYNQSMMKNQSMRDTAYSIARKRMARSPAAPAWR